MHNCTIRKGPYLTPAVALVGGTRSYCACPPCPHFMHAVLVAGYYASHVSADGLVDSVTVCPQRSYCPGGAVSVSASGSRRLAQLNSTGLIPCPDGLWTQWVGAIAFEECRESPRMGCMGTQQISSIGTTSALRPQSWTAAQSDLLQSLLPACMLSWRNCIVLCVPWVVQGPTYTSRYAAHTAHTAEATPPA